MANFVDDLVKDDHLAGTEEDDLIAGGLPQEIQEGLREFVFKHLKKAGWPDKKIKEYLVTAVEQWHEKFTIDFEVEAASEKVVDFEEEDEEDEGGFEDEEGDVVEAEAAPEINESRRAEIRRDPQFVIFQILVEKGEQLSEVTSFVELSETIEIFKERVREFFYFTDAELDKFVLEKMKTEREIEQARELREAFNPFGESGRGHGPN